MREKGGGGSEKDVEIGEIWTVEFIMGLTLDSKCFQPGNLRGKKICSNFPRPFLAACLAKSKNMVTVFYNFKVIS